ncbi:6-hydroxymethylpterin diphosphokinase MptE-like protein [Amphritea sp.]|uniref:6-hydroxymethylpterin diphosphokinase MptE-like protein n=1 Tax=Amphritea sp. TaxID=1872502 RepID=UPI003A926E7F
MLDIYKDRHKGERCIIICNGPSLNKMDLSFLKHEICFGLNKIYLGFRKFDFYPKYYVSVNEKVLRQSEAEIKELTSIKFLSNRCPDIFKNNSLTHILDTSNPQHRFCKDISSGIEEGWTVTYAALQIAYYMGFTNVIIIGMDHRFSFTGNANEENILIGEDVNHFSNEYFANSAWDNPDLLNSEESYRIAKDVYESEGRHIYDATVNGNCNIFNKIDYLKLFEGKV